MTLVVVLLGSIGCFKCEGIEFGSKECLAESAWHAVFLPFI